MKECTGCGVTKPFTEYYKHKDGKDGLRPKCKQCAADYGKKYREENREECLRRTKNWTDKNKEYVLDYQKKWYRDNFEHERLKWEKRRTVKLRLKYEFDAHTSIRIRKYTNRKCAITGDSNTHLDHFIPMNTGHGGTYEGNLILLSEDLNLSKGAKNPFVWAETLSPEHRSNFDKVIEYLAELNGLTVNKYREFVFWCFENKRKAHEITDDNRDSLTLWLRTKSAA